MFVRRAKDNLITLECHGFRHGWVAQEMGIGFEQCFCVICKFGILLRIQMWPWPEGGDGVHVLERKLLTRRNPASCLYAAHRLR